VISSKLKGVRGLGGTEGILRILHELQELGMVDFVDNNRSVRLHDDNTSVHVLKTFSAICDLESLKKLLEPVSSKGILFGSRSTGKARSDSDYDLFVVSETPEEVMKIGRGHPLGRAVELVVWTSDQYQDIRKTDSSLEEKIKQGLVLWGTHW
jgi:predicted nucleotidyltransferase